MAAIASAFVHELPLIDLGDSHQRLQLISQRQQLVGYHVIPRGGENAQLDEVGPLVQSGPRDGRAVG